MNIALSAMVTPGKPTSAGVPASSTRVMTLAYTACGGFPVSRQRKRGGLVRVPAMLVLLPLLSHGAETVTKPTFEEYVRASAVPREVIDRFLEGPSWAHVDPELGYTPGDYPPRDGIDRSATISTV